MARRHKKKLPIDPRKERVAHLVEEAFADRPYPGDEHIAINPDHCEECTDADTYFKHRPWQGLIDEDRVPIGYGSLAFLTAEAQRYFLPAYLIRGLNDTQNWAQGYAIAQVTPPVEPELRDRFEDFAEGFTPSERAAIQGFLEYTREVDPFLADDPWDFARTQKWQMLIEYWSDKSGTQAE